jgi:hypothetical protein
VRRMERMHCVYSLGLSNPVLAPVYHALAETSDPTRPPPRELLRCNSDRTAQVPPATFFSCVCLVVMLDSGTRITAFKPQFCDSVASFRNLRECMLYQNLYATEVTREAIVLSQIRLVWSLQPLYHLLYVIESWIAVTARRRLLVEEFCPVHVCFPRCEVHQPVDRVCAVGKSCLQAPQSLVGARCR